MVEYIFATLQLINQTYAYSSRKSSKPAMMFGKPVPEHIDVSYSHFTPGQESKSSSTGIDSLWFNGATLQDIEIYKQEFGSEVYLKVEVDTEKLDEHGKPRRKVVDCLTLQQYEDLKAQSGEQPQAVSAV